MTKITDADRRAVAEMLGYYADVDPKLAGETPAKIDAYCKAFAAHREAAVKEATLAFSQPDLVEQFERIITTWAYANDIDGAARNDLFKRLRTNVQPAPDAGLVVDEQIALWHSSNCELHEWLGWTEAEYHDWVVDPTKMPRLPQYALTKREGGA